ncbi:MAG: homocysteine S-methyltransferase [Steroidobacteraceae bacterium]
MASLNPIAQFLTQQPLMLLDGALATELERRGADLHDALWSAKVLMEQPNLIRLVHRDYFEAGADVAITASYQANFDAFAHRGIDAIRAAQYLRDSVKLAAQAREEFWAVPANRSGRLLPLIAASIGPYGAMLADGSEYRGHYDRSDVELMNFHRPRLEVLTQCGADVLACETMPSLREALVLARLLAEFPNALAWISFACMDEAHTCEGQRIAECVSRLNDFPQIVSVGVNCTRPEYIPSLLRLMRDQTDKPLLVYPNSGEHYDARARQWTGVADDGALAEQARGWYELGARLIGGCCRTTPADIRAIRAWASAL